MYKRKPNVIGTGGKELRPYEAEADSGTKARSMSEQPVQQANQGPDPFVYARDVAKLGVDASTAYERPDLAARVQASLERLARPDTVVCVVGEFKQGKSSLVNALVGEQICPVDDDMATAAITVLRYREQPELLVRRAGEDGPETERVDWSLLGELATERGSRTDARQIEMLEVGLPNRLLGAGVTLVDTPGVGGMVAGYATATLTFLQTADAMLFVTDASAELSAPEIEFLKEARERCPVVVVVQSKVDLYPSWQRIADLNRGHLERAEIPTRIVPVSSTIREIALNRQSAELNLESGIPALLEILQAEVLDRAREIAGSRALADTRFAAGQMAATFETELGVLENPESARATLQLLEEMKERLTYLRGPAARWSVLLNDGFATINQQVDYQFRGAMRTLMRAVEEQIEESDPGVNWDELGEGLRTDVARAVDETFARLTGDAGELRERIIDLLRDEFTDLEALGRTSTQVDISSMWTESKIETLTVSGRIFQGLGAARGSYMGLLMVGMIGNFIGIAVLGPVLLGAGLLFGGRHLVEERKKQLQKRRQQARTFVRQFVDDVQFEVGARIRETLRDLQREMRDHFTERLNELLRTCTETANATQQSMQQDQATRERRIADLRGRVEKLNELQRRVDRAEGMLS